MRQTIQKHLGFKLKLEVCFWDPQPLITIRTSSVEREERRKHNVSTKSERSHTKEETCRLQWGETKGHSRSDRKFKIRGQHHCFFCFFIWDELHFLQTQPSCIHLLLWLWCYIFFLCWAVTVSMWLQLTYSCCYKSTKHPLNARYAVLQGFTHTLDEAADKGCETRTLGQSACSAKPQWVQLVCLALRRLGRSLYRTQFYLHS